MSPSAPCACLATGPTDYEVSVVGVDETHARFGEVTVRTCRSCGRRWLHYLAEYEAFTSSGHWILGLLPDELPLPLTPVNAVPLLNSLPWYQYGGSAFSIGAPGRRARGDAPADLMSGPGEVVAMDE
jgi:hypothetical protein